VCSGLHDVRGARSGRCSSTGMLDLCTNLLRQRLWPAEALPPPSPFPRLLRAHLRSGLLQLSANDLPVDSEGRGRGCWRLSLLFGHVGLACNFAFGETGMSKLVKMFALVAGLALVGAGSSLAQERSPSDLVPRAPMTEAPVPAAPAQNGQVICSTCAPVSASCHNGCCRQRCHRARRCRGCCR
jgi:hypothetical protein